MKLKNLLIDCRRIANPAEQGSLRLENKSGFKATVDISKKVGNKWKQISKYRFNY